MGLIFSRPGSGRSPSVEAREVRLLGLRCLLVTLALPPRVRARPLRRALLECGEALRRGGCRQVLFGDGFGYTEYFTGLGLIPAGCEALLAAFAGDILALEAPRRERALLVCRDAGREAQRTAERLSALFRYVTLDAPESALRRLAEVCGRSGLSPEALPADRYADADVAALLASPLSPLLLPARCRTLTVRGSGNVLGGREVARVGFCLPSFLRFTPPGPFPLVPILSRALEAGTVSPETVKIVSLP